MSVMNYDGTFTYNFGDGESTIRPFIMGGLGATSWSPGDIEGKSVEQWQSGFMPEYWKHDLEACPWLRMVRKASWCERSA